MRESISSIQLWIFFLLIVCLTPLAAYFGSLWGWTAGAATLAILCIPTSVAALSGDRTIALSTAAAAAAGCFVGPLLIDRGDGVETGFAFPLFASCVLIAVSGVVCAVVEHLRRRVETLEDQNTNYVRQLYQRDRKSEKSEEQSAKSSEPDRTHPAEKTGQIDSVNYPMLLLTLQDVGRRISTNLDLESLIPTIVSTAKVSLKCNECQIYFWNAREKTLQNALPDRLRDSTCYIPRPGIGMARWVLEQRQILTRTAVEGDYDLHALIEEDPDMPDAIAPLAVGGELLGLLVVDKVEPATPSLARLLYILADIFALGVKNAQLFKRIEEMARQDGLTGLLNHVSFQQELQEWMNKAATNGTPLTVVMGDVDHFKKFNDIYGHQAGDHVLREVAKMWKAVLPDYAVVSRYGGEEFICILPGDDLERAGQLAEVLRESVDSQKLDFDGQQLHVTSSFGVAARQEATQSTQDLIRLADEALYNAKEAGRNRVVCDPRHPAVLRSNKTGPLSHN